MLAIPRGLNLRLMCLCISCRKKKPGKDGKRAGHEKGKGPGVAAGSEEASEPQEEPREPLTEAEIQLIQR